MTPRELHQKLEMLLRIVPTLRPRQVREVGIKRLKVPGILRLSIAKKSKHGDRWYWAADNGFLDSEVLGFCATDDAAALVFTEMCRHDPRGLGFPTIEVAYDCWNRMDFPGLGVDPLPPTDRVVTIVGG